MLRSASLVLLALTAGCVVQGGATATSSGGGADSASVLKLKKRLENLESRVERLSLAPASGGAVAAVAMPSEPTGTLRIRITEPNTLNDILDVRDWYSVVMGRRMLESLVDYHPRTRKLYGLLAERWTVDDSGLVVTFHLRKNVTWQDGEAFDADDVMFTWNALFNPAYTTSKVRADFKDAKGMKKIDAHTVQVTWKKKFFNAVGVMEGLPMMPQHVFAKDSTDFNKHPFHRAPMGTGPYKFKAWKTGDEITLQRHEDYWAKGLSDPPFAYPNPPNKTLRFIVIKEAEVALQAFKRGDIDFVGMSPDQFARNEDAFRADPTIGLAEYALPSYSYAVYNGRKANLKDKRVRQALSFAMNRDKIIERVYHGVYKRITGPFLPESNAYDASLEPRPYDLAKAAALLKEAGWTKNAKGKLMKDGKPFAVKLSMPSGSATGRSLATSWKESLHTLGIDLKVEQSEWATFLKSLNDHEFDIATLGWRLGYVNDPYGLWHSSEIKSGSNYGALNLPAMDQLVETFRETMDPAARDVLAQKIHRIVYEEQPYNFIARPAAKVAYRKYVKNFVPLPIMTINDPRGFWVDEAEKKKALGK
jgi:peptide/nickel transport system substrate-binding protein